MSYRLQILHESSYGQSQQITQNKFCNYVITNLRNYVIIIELKVWTPLSLLFILFVLFTFFPRPIRLRISRATIYFLLFPYFLRHFCLTKAYNLCHQVALVDRPMRREVAIRWTNRKRAASSLGKCHSD